MKKVLLIFVGLFLLGSAHAQNSGVDRRVENLMTKMKSVMNMTDKQSEKIQDIMIAKFEKVDEAKLKHGDNKEAMMAELGPVNRQVRMDLIDILGREKMMQWSEYLKANRKK